MLSLRYILVLSLISLGLAQHTKILSKNIFLHRKKRYLMFPEKSNFVISFSLSKPLLQIQPRGYNFLLECDVPFALPSDTKLFKNFKKNKIKRHYIERRQIFSNLESVFYKNGFDGNSCIKRMICEAQELINSGNSSLIKDMFAVLFAEFETNYQKPCYHKAFDNCPLPLIEKVLSIFE